MNLKTLLLSLCLAWMILDSSKSASVVEIYSEQCRRFDSCEWL